MEYLLKKINQVKQFFFFYRELVFDTKEQMINNNLKTKKKKKNNWRKKIEKLKACCDTGIGTLYYKSVWEYILIHLW